MHNFRIHWLVQWMLADSMPLACPLDLYAHCSDSQSSPSATSKPRISQAGVGRKERRVGVGSVIIVLICLDDYLRSVLGRRQLAMPLLGWKDRKMEDRKTTREEGNTNRH